MEKLRNYMTRIVCFRCLISKNRKDVFDTRLTIKLLNSAIQIDIELNYEFHSESWTGMGFLTYSSKPCSKF